MRRLTAENLRESYNGALAIFECPEGSLDRERIR